MCNSFKDKKGNNIYEIIIIISWRRRRRVKITIVLQFVLVGINLYLAKNQKDNGRNPAFSYFVAGMCFGFGLSQLLELLLK